MPHLLRIPVLCVSGWGGVRTRNRQEESYIIIDFPPGIEGELAISGLYAQRCPHDYFYYYYERLMT